MKAEKWIFLKKYSLASVLVNNMLFDSHCHLNDKQLLDDIDDVIKSANEAGVTHFLVIGWDIESSKKAIELAESYPNIYACVGVHPTDVKKIYYTDLLELEKLLNHPKVKALGEIGLDYYWEKDPNEREKQKEYFIKQIELADKYNLPVVIHNRDSIEDCLNIVKEHTPKYGAVVHCFSGSVEVEKEFTKLGLYISLGGPVTFKNAKTPKEVAKHVSLDKLLLETDCPYLTPHPYRGTRNEPKYIKLVAEEIASLKGISVDEVIQKTHQNTLKLFKIGYED